MQELGRSSFAVDGRVLAGGVYGLHRRFLRPPVLQPRETRMAKCLLILYTSLWITKFQEDIFDRIYKIHLGEARKCRETGTRRACRPVGMEHTEIAGTYCGISVCVDSGQGGTSGTLPIGASPFGSGRRVVGLGRWSAVHIECGDMECCWGSVRQDGRVLGHLYLKPPINGHF